MVDEDIISNRAACTACFSTLMYGVSRASFLPGICRVSCQHLIVRVVSRFILALYSLGCLDFDFSYFQSGVSRAAFQHLLVWGL